MRYLLSSKKTLIVRGPASLRLSSGKATILGAPLKFDNKIIVRPEKQLPLESFSEVNLELQLGHSGSVSEVEGSTVPRSWRTAVDILEQLKQGLVMVIGGVDVGKSTLCTFLANELFSRGIRTRLIDADIGQADLGPPTTIGQSIATDFFYSLPDLRPETLLFVGHTSPSKVEDKLTNCLIQLINHREQLLTIINTDGWILDRDAILYKVNLVEATKPDLVIGIAAEQELQPIISSITTRTVDVEVPKVILSRSRSERREIRAYGYRRFLSGGASREMSVEDVRVSLPKESPPLQEWGLNDLQNLIVGLLDEKGYLLQIGVLLRYHNNFLKIYSRTAGGVREIELGYVRLSLDGTEEGYLQV